MIKRVLSTILIAFSLTCLARGGDVPTSAPDVNADTGFTFAPRSQTGEKTRLNGTSRGKKAPAVYICCSDYCELTTHDQPTIFWYLSESTTSDFEIAIAPVAPPNDDQAAPMLHIQQHGGQAGLQRLDLSQQHVTLEPGMQYEIVVDLIVDAKHREKDSVARARIERIKPPLDLSELLSKRPSKLERADVYRRRQIWYDALAALSDEIDDRETAKASTASLHRKRSELFRSCNLPELAAAELQQAAG